MNRDFKGIWIPKEVWLSDKLTLQEKVFFVEISSLDNADGCFANNQYFAEFFGLSKTRVSLIIKSLIEKGYVTSVLIYKEGTQQILKRVIKVCYIPYLRKVKDPPQQNLNTPPLEKLKDSNTVINNTINNTKKEKVIFPFTSKNFYEHWSRWTDYKKVEHRFNYKGNISIQAALMDLNTKSKQDENVACKIIMQSIANGWKGFFELKNNNNGTDHAQQTANSVERLINKYRAEAEQEIGNA